MEEAAAFGRPLVPGGYAFGWRYKTFFIGIPIFLSMIMFIRQLADHINLPPLARRSCLWCAGRADPTANRVDAEWQFES
jgi:hypothetical protein